MSAPVDGCAGSSVIRATEATLFDARQRLPITQRALDFGLPADLELPTEDDVPGSGAGPLRAEAASALVV
jgi:hypothetical protein